MISSIRISLPDQPISITFLPVSRHFFTSLTPYSSSVFMTAEVLLLSNSENSLSLALKKTNQKLNHTTPDAVQLHSILSKLNDHGVTHVAMEASSHGLDQRRLDSVVVKVAGFTNLTQDHYDYHQGSESYFKAKPSARIAFKT